MEVLERVERGRMGGAPTRGLALALAAVLVAVGTQARDVEALAIGLALLAASSLLRWRRGTVARVVLALLFLDTLVWMAPAVVSNVGHRDDLLATARSTALAVLAATGLATLVLRGRRWPDGARVGQAVVAAIVAIVGLSQLPGVGDDVTVQPGDVVVSIRTNEFSTDAVVVDAGSIGVVVENHDLFWHTLTVEAVGLDLRVPNGGTRRTEIDLEPGTYEFICAIPGHEQAGMVGTLEVR